MSTYSLTLRGDKGSKLTIEEMDGNFLYLDGKTGTASAALPIVTNLGGGLTASYNQGSNFLGLGVTYSGQIFDTGSGGYNVMVSVDGKPVDDVGDLTIVGYFDPTNVFGNSYITTRYEPTVSYVAIQTVSGPTYSAGVDVISNDHGNAIQFRFDDSDNYYKFPTTQPSVGQVIGYESPNKLGWKNSMFLLGKKTGFDANLQSVMTNATIQYQNVVGTFSVGEIIRSNMGATGSEAIILSDLTSTLTLDSGYDDFTESQQILGLSSGASAEVVLFTYLTKADQVIDLSGGNKYLISQVVITNATSSSGSMGTADQLSIWTGPSQSGYKLFDSIQGIAQLETSDHFISEFSGQGMTTNILANDTVYASLNVVVGATASFDIYLYGFIF